MKRNLPSAIIFPYKGAEEINNILLQYERIRAEKEKQGGEDYAQDFSQKNAGMGVKHLYDSRDGEFVRLYSVCGR